MTQSDSQTPARATRAPSWGTQRLGGRGGREIGPRWTHALKPDEVILRLKMEVK